MAAAFETQQGTLVTISDILEAWLVTPGFDTTSVTDAMPIYFIGYGEGGFDIEDETVKGPGDEDMGTGQGAKKIVGKFKSEAADPLIFANLILSGSGPSGGAMGDLDTLVHWFMKNKNGECYNFFQKLNVPSR